MTLRDAINLPREHRYRLSYAVMLKHYGHPVGVLSYANDNEGR